jgi:hypothetical protein
MAEHHPEAALTLLETWRIALVRQSRAIAQGNMEELEVLVTQSAKIQRQLGKILASSSTLIHDRKIAGLIKALHLEQGQVIDSLSTQTEKLAHEIGALRKDKASLKGYRQKKPAQPRFKSERT